MQDRTREPTQRFQLWHPDSMRLAAALAVSVALFGGCKTKDETHTTASASAPSLVPPAPPPSVKSATPPQGEPATAPTHEPTADAAPPPHPGPWLWVTRSSAGVYMEPRPDKELKFGYVRRGGRLPVLADKVPGKDCSEGWYKVVSGGYICSMVGTTDENSRDVKFKPRQPNVDEILPYPYARNAHNGTPLYKSLPSRAQMLEYEPYLAKKAEPKEGAKAENKPADATDTKPAATTDTNAPSTDVVPASIDANSAASNVAAPMEPEPEKPWWHDDMKDRLHDVTLDQLSEDADGVLAKRLVRGFYVAVTGTFKWNNRTWYKTTGGLVAPADRFWQTAGSDFKGVELDGETWKLPVAWVYGGNKSATTYTIDQEKQKVVAPKGSVKRFTAIQLTGKSIEIGGKTYQELADGSWVKDSLVRVTTPGARPADVGEKERWIDVDISEQTLVAYEGDRPVYATLISSGKESKIKDKDHSTPRGAWRVREKHITTTMDGNGSAAGDLPYSIEDVPYVMYFHQAYALHGAFWHANYGSQMSHGCVNLAPLDAKHLFFFADPPAYEGLAGAWSNDKSPGSMVVVHD